MRETSTRPFRTATPNKAMKPTAAEIEKGRSRTVSARTPPTKANGTPVTVAEHKIKKTDGVPIVELRPTADTLAALGASKTPGQTIVGFAAETFDVEANALGKLTRKGADLIVANDVAAPGVGFEHETNSVTILCASGRRHEVGLTSKRAVAREILDLIVDERRS